MWSAAVERAARGVSAGPRPRVPASIRTPSRRRVLPSPRAAGGRDAAPVALKKVPLWIGSSGITAVLLNRILSGVAPVADAGSSQSRADVIAIVLSAACVLTGLQWSSIKARTYPKVKQGGEAVAFFDDALAPDAKREIQWCYDSLLASTSAACGLVVFHGGQCVSHLGFADTSGPHGRDAVMGPMCSTMVERDRGNYIPNLRVYPGRVEFTYLPETTQSLVLQPLGEDGVILVCGDTQRGFTKVDQSWIATISEKLDVTLSASD